MIIRKITTTGRLRVTGYAQWLGNEYGPLYNTMDDAIRMAMWCEKNMPSRKQNAKQ